MKLVNLIPLSLKETNHDILCNDYFRKFSEMHGINALFDYVGTKDDVMVFVCDLANFGDLSFVVSKAQIVAKCTKKDAYFGVVCTLPGLQQAQYPTCMLKRKEKDGHVSIEAVEYDPEDTKNFPKEAINFTKLLK